MLERLQVELFFERPAVDLLDPLLAFVVILGPAVFPEQPRPVDGLLPGHVVDRLVRADAFLKLF